MHRLLLLLLRHPTRLLLGQPPPNRPRLLRTQVQRQVLLVLVVYTELSALIGIDDGENAGNRFADVVAVPSNQIVSLAFGECLWDMECLGGCYQAGLLYILVSFEAAPPAIFCVRRAPSSVFKSMSCFFRSSLPFDQSWAVLILEVDYGVISLFPSVRGASHQSYHFGDRRRQIQLLRVMFLAVVKYGFLAVGR